MVLRLLDFARTSGLKFHFFASARVLRAFPTAADAILGEGHDLDWLCTDASLRGYEAGLEEFRLIGHKPVGVALESPGPEWLGNFQFASCSSCVSPGGVLCFPTSSPSDVEAVRSAAGLRAWSESAKSRLERAQGEGGLTLVLHPALQARCDAKLQHVRDICAFAASVRAPVKTLRDALNSG